MTSVGEAEPDAVAEVVEAGFEGDIEEEVLRLILLTEGIVRRQHRRQAANKTEVLARP